MMLGLVACKEMRDVATLTSALRAQYHQPVRVTMSSTGHLRIALPAESMEKVSDDDRTAFSERVARFAFDHYAQPERVHLVSVRFVTRGLSDLVGGAWEPRELTDASTPRNVAHASRQVTWVAIGDRDAPARIDVDESRLDHASFEDPQEIFVRVLYDSAVSAPGGQVVASIEVHYRVTCATSSTTMLGVEAYDRAGQPMPALVAGDPLPAWMQPRGMAVQQLALKGYCWVFYPTRRR